MKLDWHHAPQEPEIDFQPKVYYKYNTSFLLKGQDIFALHLAIDSQALLIYNAKRLRRDRIARLIWGHENMERVLR